MRTPREQNAPDSHGDVQPGAHSLSNGLGINGLRSDAEVAVQTGGQQQEQHLQESGGSVSLLLQKRPTASA